MNYVEVSYVNYVKLNYEDIGKGNIEKEAVIRNLSRSSKESMGKTVTCWKNRQIV